MVRVELVVAHERFGTDQSAGDLADGPVSANGNEIKFTREVGEFAKEEIVARRGQPAPPSSAPAAKIIRIKAGVSVPVKDAEGNVWLPDQGFEGGQTIARPDIQIAERRTSPVPLLIFKSFRIAPFIIQNGAHEPVLTSWTPN
jgi:hypothetical protein